MDKLCWKSILPLTAVIFAFGCGSGGDAQSDWRPAPRQAATGVPAAPGAPAADGRIFPEAVRITESRAYEAAPSWSPDGTRIAYTSFESGGQSIRVLDLNYHSDSIAPYGEPLRVTEGGFTDRDPAWSHDGSRIVFSSNRSGDYGLFMLDLHTLEITDMEIAGIQPSWSPLDERVAFVQKNNIAVTTLEEDAEKIRITRRGFNEFPSWSPDGRYIVFSSNYDIVRTDARGGALRHLTVAGWNSHADWCRTRDRIVFVSNEGGSYNLWKMHSDGSNKRQLTETPAMERFPRWSSDGRWVAFQADYEGSFDIWAIRVD